MHQSRSHLAESSDTIFFLNIFKLLSSYLEYYWLNTFGGNFCHWHAAVCFLIGFKSVFPCRWSLYAGDGLTFVTIISVTSLETGEAGIGEVGAVRGRHGAQLGTVEAEKREQDVISAA